MVVMSAAWLVMSGELAISAQAAEKADTALPAVPNFLLGLGVMTMFTICLMLWLGFLKTAAVDGELPQQPGFLLRCGQPYFWKMFFFIIVYEFFCRFVASTIFVGVWLAWKADKSLPPDQQIEQIAEFVQTSRLTEILMLMAYAIFIKPLLVIPSRIIVFNQRPTQAFAAMRQYRLAEIREVYRLTAVGFAATIALAAVSMLAPARTVVYYILTAAYHLMFCGVMLFLMLLAVLWMKSHYETEMARLEQEQA